MDRSTTQIRLTAKTLREIEAARSIMAYDLARKKHPVTGALAPAGQHYVRNLMGGAIVLEDDGTPWTCSVASETYWAS